MITAMPSTLVAEDSSCLLSFTGAPNRVVIWGITGGSGTLSILTDVTDANGVAMARYNAGAVGDTPTITATYAS